MMIDGDRNGVEYDVEMPEAVNLRFLFAFVPLVRDVAPLTLLSC